MKNALPKAPAGLSKAALTWWKRLVDSYAITDDAGLLMLQTALEAFDRMNQARALIEKHGVLILDKAGQLKPNPATTVERDCRSAMMLALKNMHFDLEVVKGIGRPPGSYL